jgi:hypothetical protein
MHPLLRYVVVATPLAVLLALALSGFFTAWDGRAIQARPAAAPEAPTRAVLVLADDGSYTEHAWPADLVQRLDLRSDVTGVPPNKPPEDAPRTLKSRFQVFFTVVPDGGASEAVPTLTARALSGAVLAWVLGLALFNMGRSGSPFSWERVERVLPTPEPAAGVVPPPPAAAARPQKGPPPPKRRKGARRR